MYHSKKYYRIKEEIVNKAQSALLIMNNELLKEKSKVSSLEEEIYRYSRVLESQTDEISRIAKENKEYQEKIQLIQFHTDSHHKTTNIGHLLKKLSIIKNIVN